MNLEDIRTLYAYNRWANARVLDACRPLDAASFTRDLGNSFGSIQGTLAHVLWAEWIWLERWNGRSPRQPASTDSFPDAAALAARWAEIESARHAFLETLDDAALARRIAYHNIKGERWEYSLGHMLQHVVNHSTYHRGQVITMLRQLGREAPSTDFLLYFDEQGVSFRA